MQRMRFDFDVITGPAPPRPVQIPESRPDAGGTGTDTPNDATPPPAGSHFSHSAT